MRLERNPIFRKVIIPWYDSEKICFIVIAFMIPILVFGISGISEAHENFEYRRYIWVPVLIVVLSLFVILSTTTRMIKRYIK